MRRAQTIWIRLSKSTASVWQAAMVLGVRQRMQREDSWLIQAGAGGVSASIIKVCVESIGFNAVRDALDSVWLELRGHVCWFMEQRLNFSDDCQPLEGVEKSFCELLDALSANNEIVVCFDGWEIFTWSICVYASWPITCCFCGSSPPDFWVSHHEWEWLDALF